MREGNRKDVPSEMRNRFVRLFVCLFVVSRCERLQNCGVAFRGVVYIYVRGFIRLFIVFGQFFDLEGGYLKRVMKNSSSKKFCHRSVGLGRERRSSKG